MKKGFYVLLIVSLSLLVKSCNTTDPPNGDSQALELKLEDVSCTEAWITLTTTNLQLPTTITLKQTNPTGNTKSQILNLNTQDTLLYVDSLMPNQTYRFKAILSSEALAKGDELSVTTMDTTSHDFTFETFTFGGTAGSSTLYDVAIISPDNIWCVGEILIADTSQNGYTMYNAVHWDGNQWELKRIYYFGNCSAVEYPPLKAIWAFSENDIVITNGGSIGWFDGNTVNLDCRVNPLLTGAINKIWGNSNDDLYVVGNNGNIVHYNGTNWQRIESGTDLNIYDIWGEFNQSNSNYEINLVAAQQYVGPERKILTIRNNMAEELSTLNISPGSIHGIWFKTERKYFITGNGIYYKTNIYDSNDWNTSLSSLTPYYTYAISGSSLNNIFICGSYGELLHFNGASWRSFKNTPGFFDADFFNISVKVGIAAVVGQRFSSGFITIGKLQ